MEHAVLVAEQDREPKKSTITRFEDYLIDDVVIMILSFLDETSRRHLRLVCTKWFYHINFSVFNLGMIKLSEVEEVVRIFGRYNKQIELHFKSKSPKLPIRTPVSNQEDQQVLEQLSKLTNLSALTLSHFCFHNFLTLTNLTSLKTSVIGTATLKNLTKLKKIAANEVSCDPTVNLPQLEGVSVTDTNNFGARIIPRALNLKHLTLLKTEYPTAISAGDTYNKEDFKLLTKLESLTVDALPITWDEMSTTLTRVIIMWNYGIQQSNFQSTRLTNLRHLEIRNNIDNLEIFPYLESLSFESGNESIGLPEQVTNLPNLTSLKLAQGTSFSIDILTKLTQLRHLDIFKSFWVEAIRVQVKFFREFTNLTALHLPSDFPLKEVGRMTRLTTLQELSITLFKNQRTDFFYSLTNITKLYIRQTPNFKNNLGMLTNLLGLTIKADMKLTLGDTFIGVDQLTQLTNLQFLDKVTDDHWKSISTLTNLKEYVEDGFDSADADRMTQLTVFKNLTKLITSSSEICAMEHLTTLTKLQVLHLKAHKDQRYDKKMLSHFPYLVDFTIRVV